MENPRKPAINQHTLYADVHDFYSALAQGLDSARRQISMCYLAFEDGFWAREFARILHSKMKQGIRVRLMVDELGQLTDEPQRLHGNFEILDRLQSSGVHVDVFRPSAPLYIGNRVHAKFTGIDDRIAFLGGSNIGDYYTTWSDTNLCLDGRLGNTFHKVYDLLHGFSRKGDAGNRRVDVNNLRVGNEQLWLTVPRHSFGLRDAMLRLIRNADRAVFVRTWYFLPDKEMLEALCQQAEKGVQVNVLLSHRTRIRAVDFANHIHVHKLVCAGADVHRYMGRYMHSKAAWNDRGDALIGSANLNSNSMSINFETCLEIHDTTLTWELRRAFYADLADSPKQTPESYSKRSLTDKAITHACNLASPWL